MSDTHYLVIAATEFELRGVPRKRADITAVTCGVGPVDAGIYTALAISHCKAANPGVAIAVIHIGICGVSRASSIAIGSTILASESFYVDSKSHLVTTRITPDPELKALVASAISIDLELPIATSADVGGSHSRQDDLGIKVEAMEGFAVLRAARLLDTPAIELRVISNEIEEQDRSKWQFENAFTILSEKTRDLIAAIS